MPRGNTSLIFPFFHFLDPIHFLGGGGAVRTYWSMWLPPEEHSAPGNATTECKRAFASKFLDLKLQHFSYAGKIFGKKNVVKSSRIFSKIQGSFGSTSEGQCTTQVEVLAQNDLWKYPSRLFLLMKIPRQTKNAYDPDFASFKTLVRLGARSKTLMKRLVQTKMRYDTDFGSFHLWKDSERPKNFMIQTLDRSIYEKIGAKKYRQKWRTKRRYLSVFVGFIGFACLKRWFHVCVFLAIRASVFFLGCKEKLA